MSYHRVGKFVGLAGVDDFLKDIGSSIGKVGGGLLDILGTPQQEAGRAAALEETQRILAAQQAAQAQARGVFSMEKALPFIAIGGGILLIVLLASKKKGSAS